MIRDVVVIDFVRGVRNSRKGQCLSIRGLSPKSKEERKKATQLGKNVKMRERKDERKLSG